MKTILGFKGNLPIFTMGIFKKRLQLFKNFINILTAQKKKFSIKDFFSKCDQIRSHIYQRNP